MARERIPIGSYGNIPKPRELDNGNFQASTHFRFSDGSLRIVKKNGATAAKAVNALKAKLATLSQAHGAIKPDTRMPVVVAAWLDTLPDADLKQSSREKYAYVAERVLLRSSLVNYSVRDMDPTRVHLWLKSLTGNHKSARAVLKSVLDQAVLSGALPRNPVLDTPAFKPPTAEGSDGRKALPRGLDAQHLAAVRYAITAWETEPDMYGHPKRRTIPLRDILMVQLVIAGRINETLGLHWADVDLDNATLYVERSLQTHRGPRERGLPKSLASERGITVPDVVVAMLRRRLAESQQRMGDEWTADSPVFTTRTGRYFTHQNINRAWREARALAPEGFDLSWVVPHTMRKTAGTAVADALGVLAGSKMLGHADTAVFEKHYLDRSTGVSDVRAHTQGLVEGL